MGLRQFFKDFTEAAQTSSPLLRQANATQETIYALLREVQAKDSSLTADEKATRRREIDILWEQARQESKAARQPMERLKARYPGWIK